MEILGGKSDLLSGWFSEGSFFTKKPAVQLFQAGNLPPGYLQLTGANADNFAPEFFGSVSGPKSRSPLSLLGSVTTPSGLKISSTGDKTRDMMIERFGAPPAFLQKLMGIEPETFSEAETGAPVTADQTGGVNEAGGIFGDISAFIEGLVARVAIIILGFIFVAVGLAMFKNPAAAVSPVKIVKGAL